MKGGAVLSKETWKPVDKTASGRDGVCAPMRACREAAGGKGGEF